ncbi:MAG: hypothetical protein ACTSR4_04360 [Candidatus Hodarchaeales archaeon]
MAAVVVAVPTVAVAAVVVAVLTVAAVAVVVVDVQIVVVVVAADNEEIAGKDFRLNSNPNLKKHLGKSYFPSLFSFYFKNS